LFCYYVYTQHFLHQLHIPTKACQRQHVLPQSGWVSYWINRGEDIPEVIELFRMRYEQLKPKAQIKQENKEEEGTVVI
jgi:Family of unknown function (DUF5519)